MAFIKTCKVSLTLKTGNNLLKKWVFLPINPFTTSAECWRTINNWIPFDGHSKTIGNTFTLVVVQSTTLFFFFFFLPGRSEDLSWVGTYGVDGAVMTSDLSYGGEVVYIPHLQHAAPTGAQQHGPARDIRQSAHPVLMGVGDLLWSQSRET